MAHFAQLDENNIVQQVIVVANSELWDENGNEVEKKGIEFCQRLLGGRWKQTSYNQNFRKNYAGIGFKYDEELDAFIPPKPEGLSSWILDPETCLWKAPVDIPPFEDDNPIGFCPYEWDEETVSWVKVDPPV